ncbi:MAG: hypothetical protein JWM27_4194 [Gemmatimonadetes bacterium]|nr:hypothetical protein [Gemmatimonadota bacterium]
MHSPNRDALHVDLFVVLASEPAGEPGTWPMITAACSLWNCPITG